MRECIDCLAEGVTTKRPAPHGGPRSARCTTHYRKVRRERKKYQHGRRIEATYGITSEEYWMLYEKQGRTCYVCQKSNGRRKRLAVDHDHNCTEGHDPNMGCPKCVRCLACGPCNQMIGRWNAEALKRAIEVLTDPPAKKVLRPGK